MWVLVLSILIVIGTSALCSFFEAVLYSLPISYIEELVSRKQRSGMVLQRLRQKVDEPIAAILTLNTFANTAGAALAGSLAASVLGDRWVIWFSIGFAISILLLSEILPKTIGVFYNRAAARIVAYPILFLVLIFRPVIWLVSFLTRLIYHGKPIVHTVTKMELLSMAKASLKGGAIQADQAAVIENMLALENKHVKDVMTPRTVVVALEGTATVDDARKMEGVLAHSNIPVYFDDMDTIVGVVYLRNILLSVADDHLTEKISTLMKPIRFVAESMPLDQVLRMFLGHRQHLMAVIDEFGSFAGIISLEDVLETILGKEIVGVFDEAVDMRELAKQQKEAILQNIRHDHLKR